MQNYIEKTFARVQYGHRLALMMAMNELHACGSREFYLILEALASALIQSLQSSCVVLPTFVLLFLGFDNFLAGNVGQIAGGGGVATLQPLLGPIESAFFRIAVGGLVRNCGLSNIAAIGLHVECATVSRFLEPF